MSKLEQFEIKKYWQIFSGVLKQNNTPKETKLSYDLVKPILFNSKLDSSILNKIWNLADIDDDDCLDFEEFVICMRLLFDMVNKTISSVPDQLPDWLIPGSKIELLKKKNAENNHIPQHASIKQEEPDKVDQSPETQQAYTTDVINLSSSSSDSSEDNTKSPFEDSKTKESSESYTKPERSKPPVEWYMSPSEKNLYETIYSTSNLSLEKTISFQNLYESLKSKVLIANINNITELDVSKVWHLLNPSNLTEINKDPAIYIIHVIKQMNDNDCEIPSSVPRSLIQTFKQNSIDTNLNSSSNKVKTTELYSTPVLSNSVKKINEGTDFSSYEGKDWEKVRLKQQLNKLDDEFEKITKEAEVIAMPSHLTIVKEQFEQLLKYKQDLLINATSAKLNESQFKDDMEIVAENLNQLEAYLKQRTNVLEQIKSEL
ncbi:related to Actin cytoskeleton-regulatory complex protein END3 [Hanseniaspora guilliermondii]|uniref:Actin cytoskeleton-regulatory complex protein END3 n=1 Tax=Hanseniaspora guilliermondii TaxID=56406 RepID=A0A1L0FKP4_9ASCO|nr:related to Actin cytoskeleton-regulatory complex protein END3 [Hanseniaspora guilliermondii]